MKIKFLAIGKITEKDLNKLHTIVTDFSKILKDVYLNELTFNEVNSLVELEYYSDENILLNDLIMPEKSNFMKNIRCRANIFKDSYDLAKVKILKAQKSNRISVNDLDDYLIENGVSIYFPYSANFKGKKIKEITIVMPPKEDTNEAFGVRLFKCANEICEEKVLVNDNYAMKNPTHIIYAGGVNVTNKIKNKIKNTRNNTINTTYFGSIRYSKQYDSFISFTGNGGGSEFKIFRGSGYLSYDTNNQITNINGDITSVDISRSEINNCSVLQVNSIWDADWKEDNFEQVLSIYEEDNKGEVSFTGTLNTTIKVFGQNQTGSLSYTIKRTSQDEIIKNWKINRAAYKILNSQNQGYGMTSGGTLWQVPYIPQPWAVYDGPLDGTCGGANVSFSLPDKMF